MKKIFYKQLPKYFYLIVVMFLTLALEALFSIQMMKTVDLIKTPDVALLKASSIKMIVLALVSLPCMLLLSYCKATYRKGSVIALKKHYLKGIFGKALKDFHGNRSGDYVSGITNDIHTIETHYIEGIYTLFYGACSFLVGVGVIAYVSPYIILGGVAFGGLMAILSSVIGKPLRKQQEERSSMLGEYTAFIKEALSAFHIIKVNGLESKIKEDFYDKSKHIQDRGYSIDKMYTFVSAFQSLLSAGVMVGLVVFAIYLSVKGQVTFGGIILVVSNLEKLMRPLSEIGEWMPKIQSSKAIFNKLDNLLVSDDLIVEDMTIARFEKDIVLNNIAYSYDDKKVLNDVNLTLERGKKYLVVGPSGGGKSTLLKLLRKYLSPVEGHILIDGKPLSKVSKKDYYKLIGNIEQQVFLFEDTLRNNLSLYKEMPDEVLFEALNKAGLSDFIAKTPEGLDYMIYDNGKNLSGGERSRVAIARGLLQNAQILYLDEAFSSLDATVAKEIEKTVLALKDITVINVSHVIFEESKMLYDDVFKVHGNVTVV